MKTAEKAPLRLLENETRNSTMKEMAIRKKEIHEDPEEESHQPR